jgi:hypothetical protein
MIRKALLARGASPVLHHKPTLLAMLVVFLAAVYVQSAVSAATAKGLRDARPKPNSHLSVKRRHKKPRSSQKHKLRVRKASCQVSQKAKTTGARHRASQRIKPAKKPAKVCTRRAPQPSKKVPTPTKAPSPTATGVPRPTTTPAPQPTVGPAPPVPASIAGPPFTFTSASTTWNPLQEQIREPDTLFLLDPTAEAALAPGSGGFITPDALRGTVPWQSSSGVVEAPGKFRQGLQSVNRSYGYLWMPMEGYLPTDEFTVEFWLKANGPWSRIADNTPLSFQETYYDGVSVNLNAGWLALNFSHGQAVSGHTSATLRYNVSALPANQWTSVAFTYLRGTLDLYVGGALVGAASNVAPPAVWSDQARGDGFDLEGARGKGATSVAISDLRISRVARTPGQQTSVSNANTVSVNPAAPTGATINQNLLGGLHTLGGPATETMAHGVLKVMRTDKLLAATPIKAGAPDAAHPSVGVSGVFSYDWQVVDRTLAYYTRLGVTPYISIDSTPQLLGGSVPPFSGTALATERSYQSGFSAEVPNDLTAWGTIVRDLVNHITVEDGYTVPYWGVWNEPDGSSFWKGTLSDYLALYAVTAQAVKSVNPALKVGGPEVASWNTTWVKALIDYCATNAVPLDFVSWHYYSGDLGEIAQAHAQVTHWAGADNLPVPQILVGEWAWQVANLPGFGTPPFSNTNYFVNDWHAAFAAESLMQMQANGVVESIYTDPVAEDGATGWAGTGLMSSTHPWANLNVFRMWSMLEPNVLPTTTNLSPGLMSEASTGSNGHVTVMLADLRFRKDATADVQVQLPPAYAGWTVTNYLVDDQHSDTYDAGLTNANLEHLAPTQVIADGTVDAELLPRSVHLLVISPPT